MTADIGSQVYCDEAEAKRRDLLTRDLLGGSCAATTKDLHLDPRIPHGWERLSGEIYVKKSNPDPTIHELELPPPPPPRPAFDHQCTLEKVRSALERAGREPGSSCRRRPTEGSPSTSSSSSTSSTSSKRRARDGSDSTSSGSLTAAGCSRCSTYVLISSSNPRCPRCDSHVPLVPSPVVPKKPRMEEYMKY